MPLSTPGFANNFPNLQFRSRNEILKNFMFSHLLKKKKETKKFERFMRFRSLLKLNYISHAYSKI